MWILSAFALWIFAFRGYLSSRSEFTSDALSYYDHTKFFIENLGQGVFPLWDPYWCHGSSNDFFLRRIGAFNPFYLIILLFKSVGIPYILSYLWFLAIYYWSGMIAFYLLAMRMYQDRLIAYSGYLILMFSALGTRLFDSYMMLVTVPLIWFFYFLTAFSQTPRKDFFLGMSLSFMILAGTYIPFYFLIILGIFLILFFVIYFDQVPAVFRSYAVFFKNNKILVLMSLLILILTFIPIINFFHETAHGQIVLPQRHGGALEAHALVVSHQTLDWGMVEDFMYSAYFSNLKLYKFAVVYVPFFSVIVFLLGLAGRISRRAVFIFLLGIVLACCIVPHGLPFYDFFYQHLFFLKYFRNLHFFIWFFLIPLFVFLVLEHWKMFIEIKLNGPRQKVLLLFYVLFVHLSVLAFVCYRADAVVSTYIMILLSFIFWTLIVLKLLKANFWGFALLTLTVLVQPLETYYYFSLKSVPHLSHYDYDFSYKTIKINDPALINPKDVPVAKQTLYYASGGYNFIYQNVSNYALEKYLQSKFVLVDHLQEIDRQKIDASQLEHNFLTDDNTAVVFPNQREDLKLNGNDPNAPLKIQHIDESIDGFKLLDFDANHIRLSLKLPYEKFLIYNDSYDPHWQATVNQVRVPLYEVNGAFKGIWVGAGENIIEFKYGSRWQYALNIFLCIAAYILLMGTVFYARFP